MAFSLVQRVSAAVESFKSALSPNWSTLERYLAWAFGGGAAASGIIVNPQTAMQAGAVHACIKVLAESVGMLPCNLLKKTGKNFAYADTHALYPLLHDQPNDFQSSVEFWEMMVLHLCLRGNAYAFVNRTKSGFVAELLPQHPDMVRTEMQSDYTLQYQIAMPSGEFKTMGPGEIFHIRGLTVNGWLGISPIAYAREAIGLALAAEKFGGQLFRNGAKMGGILQHPGKLSDDAYRRVKESFDASSSGENAHKTSLLEEGMTWKEVTMSPEDSQFLATRQYQRSEIASIFRVPPHMIGDLSRATFSNIEQQSLEFVSYSLMPWLTRIEKAVRRDLLTDKEKVLYSLKFDSSGLLRGDSAARGAFYKSGINDGWLTRNEARASESAFGFILNPLEDLDEPLLPLNMREVSDPPPDPATATPPPGDPKLPPADDGTAKSISELAHAIATQSAPTVIVEAPIIKMDVAAMTVERTFPALKFVFNEKDEITGAQPLTTEE